MHSAGAAGRPRLSGTFAPSARLLLLLLLLRPRRPRGCARRYPTRRRQPRPPRPAPTIGPRIAAPPSLAPSIGRVAAPHEIAVDTGGRLGADVTPGRRGWSSRPCTVVLAFPASMSVAVFGGRGPKPSQNAALCVTRCGAWTGKRKHGKHGPGAKRGSGQGQRRQHASLLRARNATPRQELRSGRSDARRHTAIPACAAFSKDRLEQASQFRSPAAPPPAKCTACSCFLIRISSHIHTYM